MPNIITHALCAQDALERLGDSPLKSLIQKYPQVYAMASSGPDFMFYFRVMPWQDQSRNTEVYGVGNDIHNSKIDEFYLRAMELIRLEEDPVKQEILQVFLAGHLTHWSLDTIAHPYVFFHTGEMKGKTRYWHYRLESMIDTLMVKAVKKYKLEHTRSYDIVRSTSENRAIIGAYYRNIVRAVYGTDLELEVYEECLASMHSTSKLLFDPYEMKLPFIQKLEKTMKAPWKFSSHMVLGIMDVKHDILNLKHREWVHPCDDRMTSTKSFIDLYQEGVVRALSGLNALNAIFFESYQPLILTSLIQDRNYDTGLANPGPMLYYRPIYEENE